jgi:GMP synthase (glutamine-hydrolysing)
MVLLIQFRTDQSGWHEIKSVYEATDLPQVEFVILNAGNHKTTAEDMLHFADKADLVLLGGVGESGYEATSDKKKEAFIDAKEKMQNVLPALAESGIPTLGLCFGHQLIADTLGGSVTKDDELAETGVAEIHLTDAGKEDKLFADMDDCFGAIVGHKVSVTELPDNSTLLARSDTCPIQAFRYEKNIYGFQFHPELDKQGLADRLDMYPEYKNNQIINNTDKAVTADSIARRAVEVFVD